MLSCYPSLPPCRQIHDSGERLERELPAEVVRGAIYPREPQSRVGEQTQGGQEDVVVCRAVAAARRVEVHDDVLCETSHTVSQDSRYGGMAGENVSKTTAKEDLVG